MVWGKLFRPCSCSCIGPFWWDSYQPDWVCEGCFQISLLIQSQFKHDGLIGENIGEADEEGKEKQTWKNSQISVFFISIGTFPSPIDLSNIIGHITQTLLVISLKHYWSYHSNIISHITQTLLVISPKPYWSYHPNIVLPHIETNVNAWLTFRFRAFLFASCRYSS